MALDQHTAPMAITTKGRRMEMIALEMDLGTEDDFENRQSSDTVVSTDTAPTTSVREVQVRDVE